MALLIAEKDRQSSHLMSFEKVNKDLQSQLRDFDQRLKDAKSRCRASDSKVVYYESVDYTAKVMDIYQSSPAYEAELYSKCNRFYERGCEHILRQFHYLTTDKALMCRAFEGS